MVIIPDPILSAILLVPFLVTMVSLHFILFKPMLQYLDERNAAGEAARGETGVLLTQLDDRMAVLNERIEEARAEVGDHRSAARGRALEAEAKILKKAREEADERVQTAVKKIAGEHRLASTTLRGTAQSLSRDVASQVLGREIRA